MKKSRLILSCATLVALNTSAYAATEMTAGAGTPVAAPASAEVETPAPTSTKPAAELAKKPVGEAADSGFRTSDFHLGYAHTKLKLDGATFDDPFKGIDLGWAVGFAEHSLGYHAMHIDILMGYQRIDSGAGTTNDLLIASPQVGYAYHLKLPNKLGSVYAGPFVGYTMMSDIKTTSGGAGDDKGFGAALSYGARIGARVDISRGFGIFAEAQYQKIRDMDMEYDIGGTGTRTGLKSTSFVIGAAFNF